MHQFLMELFHNNSVFFPWNPYIKTNGTSFLIFFCTASPWDTRPLDARTLHIRGFELGPKYADFDQKPCKCADFLGYGFSETLFFQEPKMRKSGALLYYGNKIAWKLLWKDFIKNWWNVNKHTNMGWKLQKYPKM